MSEEPSRPGRKVPIRRIIFQNAPLLSSKDRRGISRALRNEEVEADLSGQNATGVADEAAERVRAAYQNDGYFKAQVEAKSVPVAGEAAARYDVVVHVLEEGRQYRLGDLRLVHMKAFSEQQLRDLFRVQRGEIFSPEKIAKDLQVDLDEGRLFHWGKLHVDGMRNQDSEILLKAWEGLQGQIYSPGNQELEGFSSARCVKARALPTAQS